MSVSNCKACGHFLGNITEGDIYCKCGTFNIIRDGKLKNLVIKQLYTKPKATVHNSQ